jgi:hypothetical protein
VHDGDPEAVALPCDDDVVVDELVEVAAASEVVFVELHAAAIAPMPSAPNAPSAWRRSSSLRGSSMKRR